MLRMLKTTIYVPVPEEQRRHWAVLSGVRFLLALCVLTWHSEDFATLPRLLHPLQWIGPGAAVSGFFLISGYSIAASLERDQNTLAFYSRRLDRLYPACLTGLVLSVVFFALNGPVVHNLRFYEELPPGHAGAWLIVGNALFLQGILCHAIPADKMFWTLGIEATYYVFAPLFLRIRLGALLGLVAFSALAFLLRSYAGANNLIENLGGISAICLLWLWLAGFLVRRFPASSWTKLIALVMPAALFPWYDGDVPLLASATLVIVAFLLIDALPLVLKPRAGIILNWLGDLSYPLYAIHYPVMLLSAAFIEKHFKGDGWAYIGIALAGAILTLHLVDYPHRRYRRWTAARGRDKQVGFSPPTVETAAGPTC